MDTLRNIFDDVWQDAIVAGLVKEDESQEDYKLIDHRGFINDVSGFEDIQQIYDGLSDLTESQPEILSGNIAIEFDSEIQSRFKELSIDWTGDVGYLLQQMKSLLVWIDLKIHDAHKALEV